MALTKAEQENAISKFDEVAPHAECNLCGSKKFGMGSGIVTLPIGINDCYLCLALICQVCGNTFLINTKVIKGIWEEPK